MKKYILLFASLFMFTLFINVQDTYAFIPSQEQAMVDYWEQHRGEYPYFIIYRRPSDGYNELMMFKEVPFLTGNDSFSSTPGLDYFAFETPSCDSISDTMYIFEGNGTYLQTDTTRGSLLNPNGCDSKVMYSTSLSYNRPFGDAYVENVYSYYLLNFDLLLYSDTPNFTTDLTYTKTGTSYSHGDVVFQKNYDSTLKFEKGIFDYNYNKAVIKPNLDYINLVDNYYDICLDNTWLEHSSNDFFNDLNNLQGEYYNKPRLYLDSSHNLDTYIIDTENNLKISPDVFEHYDYDLLTEASLLGELPYTYLLEDSQVVNIFITDFTKINCNDLENYLNYLNNYSYIIDYSNLNLTSESEEHLFYHSTLLSVEYTNDIFTLPYDGSSYSISTNFVDIDTEDFITPYYDMNYDDEYLTTSYDSAIDKDFFSWLADLMQTIFNGLPPELFAYLILGVTLLVLKIILF